LDAGGGPGRYAIDLASRGYDVALLDLTPANLERGRHEIDKAGVSDRVKSINEGSSSDLSRYADGTFDAVLCTGGPLSHVYPQSERRKALFELVRVAKPARLFSFL
jgi:ubiquinone/menaquinone biosynthesis C-methylase UbiE